MLFKNILALAVVPLATAVPIAGTVEVQHHGEESSCFKRGASWGSKKFIAREFAHEMCKGKLGGNYYKTNETRRAKTDLVKGFNPWPKVVQLTIAYEGDNAHSFLSEADCTGNLTWFVDHCKKGGRWSDGQFAFT